MNWVVTGIAVGLGCLAAWWLTRRAYRLVDDELHRSPAPWWVPVGVATGALLGAAFFRAAPLVVVSTYLLALVWALVLAVVDLDVRRLPDLLTLPAYRCSPLLLLGCSAVTGDVTALPRAAVCAVVSLLVFVALVLVSPGAQGMGLGDAKLAGVLGGLLGWIGWMNAVLGVLTGFVLGGVVAALLLVTRRAGPKSSFSFGPAMILGAYVWCLLPVG